MAKKKSSKSRSKVTAKGNSPEAKVAIDKVNAAVVTSESPAKFASDIKTEMGIWQQLLPEVLALPAE